MLKTLINKEEKMHLFKYMLSSKYKNYIRNKEIFDEKSSGIFRATVNSRIKLELMGSGAIVSSNNVMTGFDGGGASYSSIDDLIVPSNLLSSVTSTYISFSTTGRVTFDGNESEYMLQKVKLAIKEQSIGGSCLLKLVEKDGQPYINIYNAISYYAIDNDYIQDIKDGFVIFNLIEETDSKEVYLLETHLDNEIVYSKISKERVEENNEIKVRYSYLDCAIEGMLQKEGENSVIVSYEAINKPVVAEVVNLVFSGNSDYTDDNVALLREIVVTNTINSQTFDKISNPLLALPEEALEYDDNGTAKVNLQDRVIIIREGGSKPEQIALESRIEQSDQHRANLEQQIFSSLAVNPIALGVGGNGTLSGEAIKRMLENTSARVIEKRNNVAKAFEGLTGTAIEFSDPIGSDKTVEFTTTKLAVDGGFMSVKQACEEIGNADDYEQIQKENKEAIEFEV